VTSGRAANDADRSAGILAGWTGGILPPFVGTAAGSRRSSRLEGGAPIVCDLIDAGAI